MNKFKLRIIGDLGFEFWMDIPGYEGLYQASTYGRVKSIERNCIRGRGGIQKVTERFLSLANNKGYLICRLYKKGTSKCIRIHRLVGTTFLPKMKPSYVQINHKDENRVNNRVENLEWCDCTYNNNYGTRTDRAIAPLRKEILQFDLDGSLISVYSSLAEASRQTHFSTGNISSCCNGLRKTANGYIWKYKKDA